MRKPLLVFALALAVSAVLSWLCYEWDPPSPWWYVGPAGSMPLTKKFWILFEAARLLLPGFLVGASRIPRRATIGAIVTVLSFLAAGVFVGMRYGATPLWAPWISVALAHAAFGAVGAALGSWAMGPEGSSGKSLPTKPAE
jgi:hypothetical protein